MNLLKRIYYSTKDRFPTATLIIYKGVFQIFTKLIRLKNILQWFIPSRRLLVGKPGRDQRLLLIYDLSTQPFSIGDFLVVQEAAMIQCANFKFKYADIIIINNTEIPNQSKEFSSINSENTLFHLASILPVAQFNKNAGSILIFNTHLQAERYIAGAVQKYHIWPSGFNYAAGDYLYWSSINRLMYNFHKEHGFLPIMQPKSFLLEWASVFYKKNIGTNVPITINIRNNKMFSGRRNSDIDAWITFFADCQDKYPVTFIIICSVGEIDDRLRSVKNVILAKDFNTGIEQDLTLIHTSAAHMGVPSGPFSIAWFNVKPYRMFKFEVDSLKRYKGIIHDGDFFRFSFSNSNQCMTTMPETVELLQTEFKDIWGAIQQCNYQENYLISTKNYGGTLTWMR